MAARRRGSKVGKMKTFTIAAENLGEVREFAEGLPDKFLRCRSLGHNWVPHSAGHHPDGGYERVLRCSRCAARREMSLNAIGVIISSQYKHPDGYLAPSGTGSIVGEGRGILRIEEITREIKRSGEKVPEKPAPAKKAPAKKAATRKAS